MSVEEFMAIGFEFDQNRADRCVECGMPLSTTITGRVKTPDGDICSDCHFEMMDKICSNLDVNSFKGRVCFA